MGLLTALVIEWILIIQQLVVIEPHLLIELGIQLRKESVVALRAFAREPNDVVLVLALFCLINPNVDLVAVLEIVLAVVIVQLVVLIADALAFPLIAPRSWQPAVDRVLLDELFALASTNTLNVVEVLQF